MFTPRFFCDRALATGAALALPSGAARHIQVLRLQPGDVIRLFDGRGGEFDATIDRMGRSEVAATVGAQHPIEREAARAVHLALGMPANERMDWLVEKATELGAASIQPLVTAHGVLRLSGERAAKKVGHWQAIAIAACEQCGRNRVPAVRPVQAFADWIDGLAPPVGQLSTQARWLLSLAANAQPVGRLASGDAPSEGTIVLSGPEGGLSSAEEAIAVAHGFVPRSLGPRVLRAETAAIAALARLAL